MSDSVYSNITFNDLDDFSSFKLERMEKQDKPEKKAKGIVFLKFIVAALIVILVVELLLATTIIPGLKPAVVEVEGNISLSDREIKNLIAEIETTPWVKFDTSKAVMALSYAPSFEEVYIDKVFPDKVKIKVKERTPVATTMIQEEGKCVSVQIDKNGVLFKKSIVDEQVDTSIPLITGAPIAQLAEGSSIPVKYRKLLERIKAISDLPQNYFAAISEIRIVPKESGNYELELFPEDYHVRVFADSMLTRETLDYMLVTLSSFRRENKPVSELDLRYGAVSYRMDYVPEDSAEVVQESVVEEVE